MTDRLSTGGHGGQHPGDGNSGDTRKILPFPVPAVRLWHGDGAADPAAPLPGGPRGDDDDFDHDCDTDVDITPAEIEETASRMGFGSTAELERYLDANRDRLNGLIRDIAARGDVPDQHGYDGSSDFPDGFDDDDPPPPAAPAALTIRAPRGPQPVTPGYTVSAVVLYRDDDGEENVETFGFLTPKKMQSESVAVGVANFKALRPERLPIRGATHILVNDETGREVYRRPLLQVA